MLRLKISLQILWWNCAISNSAVHFAETGMAGPPSKDRNSTKNGQCYLGLVISTEVRYKFLEFNPFLTRKEHQLMFAIEALVWVEKELRKMC